MLRLSAITIKLGESKSYLRLVLVIYLLSIVLVMYAPLYLLIKLVLIGVISVSLKVDCVNKSPGNGIKKIQFIEDTWILETQSGSKEHYSKAQVLIKNILFQLIQFTDPQKRLIVLFHDQVPTNQLHQLCLKMAHNENKKE